MSTIISFVISDFLPTKLFGMIANLNYRFKRTRRVRQKERENEIKEKQVSLALIPGNCCCYCCYLISQVTLRTTKLSKVRQSGDVRQNYCIFTACNCYSGLPQSPLDKKKQQPKQCVNSSGEFSSMTTIHEQNPYELHLRSLKQSISSSVRSCWVSSPPRLTQLIPSLHKTLIQAEVQKNKLSYLPSN